MLQLHEIELDKWLFLIILFLGSPVLADKGSSPTLKAEIDAALSEDGKVIRGTVEFTIANDSGDTLSTIPLWLYPNRFSSRDPGLTDRLARWIYPAGNSTGGVTLKSIIWNGVSLSAGSTVYESIPHSNPTSGEAKNVLARVQLPSPLLTGETGTLSITFQTRIPERRGRFGHYRGTTVMGGGWFPRPLTDLKGIDTDLPPEIISVNLRLSLPTKRGAVIHDRVFPWKKKARTVEVRGLLNETVPVVVMKKMEITEHRSGWGTILHIHQELDWQEPSWNDTREDHRGLPNGLPDPGRFNISRRMFDVAENTARLIRTVAPRCPLKDRLVLVDIPAWDRLVQAGPGPVLVSDRLWRIFPIEDGLFFHDLELARQIAGELVRPVLSSRQPAQNRYLAADVTGSFFLRLYSEEIHKKERTIEDIVRYFSVLSIVDNLIYAPEVPFREVYSKSIEEPDFLRDEPWRFMNRAPRGKRILGKLEDLVGPEGSKHLVAKILVGASFRESVESALGNETQRFFATWFEDYPKVNYKIADVSDRVMSDGRFKHRVEVVRQGEVLREPVTIRLNDESGTVEDIVWDDLSPRGVIEWTSNAPIETVEIDPEHRLVEASELTPDHPLADNLKPLPWRPPMFTRFLIWGDLINGEPYLQLSVSLRRKYDLTNSIALHANYTPRSYGGVIGYYRYFGKKRTLNYRTWYMGPTVSVNRYLEVKENIPEIPPETRFAATLGSVGFQVGYNKMAYGWDPLSGSAFWVSGRYSLGADDDGELVQIGSLTTGGGVIFSPAIRHTFALYGGAMGLAGKPVAATLVTLSGREILRGFEIDETYGRVGLYAVMEYRHTILDAAQLRGPLYSWFDRFQGVLFVGGGTISKPDGYEGMFSENRIFTEVGYGLRIHALTFGVQQYLIGIDLAFPITPLERYQVFLQDDGSEERLPRSMYKIVFGINHTF